MEQHKTEKHGNKRARDESVFDSPESKRVHTEPNASDADVDLDSPEAKQIRENILDILDEPETVSTDGVPEIQDLDSLIKSFEEEIINPGNNYVDLTSSDNSGDSQWDLGYLLEASDHELGLPPTIDENMMGFDNELLRYDSFDLGMIAGIMDGDNYHGENDGDFFTVGGLFDCPNQSNFSESLPAL
ncbi:uncharacterized protein LOC132053948 [Lycium ferocissimum]|uniref:uncharacterized protein LOC132053948 n=1 Tax=Lycium ferocissimum TaxID=112874 RepID=UPI002815AC35|nr:uncharacterized protein LOC132053948 [Lycium ferocissimum]